MNSTHFIAGTQTYLRLLVLGLFVRKNIFLELMDNNPAGPTLVQVLGVFKPEMEQHTVAGLALSNIFSLEPSGS